MERDAPGEVADGGLGSQGPSLQRLHHWSACASQPCPPVHMHTLVVQQERRTPHSTALVSGEGVATTYRCLLGAGRSVAAALRGLGVRQGQLVGLLAPRGLEMVVGALGALLANAGYVPLMPDFPTERLRFILEDASVGALVVGRRCMLPLAESILGRSASPLLLVEGASVSEVGPPCLGPEPIGEALLEPWRLPMLVLYTSGSTGAPKGVLMDHEHFLTHSAGYISLFGLRPTDRGLQQATYSFGLHTSELWPLLLLGGTVLLAREGFLTLEVFSAKSLSPGDGVSLIMSVPSVVAAALAENAFDPVRSTSHVICVGEPYPADLYSKLRQRQAAFAIVCAYGCTETHVNSIWSSLAESRREVHTVNVPVGEVTPWHTLRCVVDGRLVGAGEIGEAVVSGRGLVMGYLGRPEATRKAFSSDPFGGGLCYRTGDLVRWLGDGSMEFLGRRDFQVKLRGQRVELGEIESVLRAQPEVTEAVVLLRDFEDGQPRLVAYVSPASAAGDGLLAACAAVLPPYMVPSLLTGVDEWPRTRSGKMDRMALARLDLGPRRSKPFRAAEDALEAAVVEAMASVLALAVVGADDDFVTLGGHSLLAVRLQRRLQDRALTLTAQDVLELRTPARLAARWREAREAVGTDGLDPRRPSVLAWARPAVQGAVPVSLLQEQVLSASAVAEKAYSVPMVLALEGDFSALGFERALRAVAARQRVFLGSYERGAEGFLHRLAPPEISVAQQQSSSPGDAEAQAAEAAERLTPSLRQVLLAQVWSCGSSHALLLSVHHAVFDGPSAGLLWKELRLAYAALEAKEELPPLPVQYDDFAAWQRAMLARWPALLEEDLAYWRGHLRGAPALALPTDRPRPRAQSFEGGAVTLVVPRAAVSAFEEALRRRGSTLFQGLLAAWGGLLGRLAQQEEVVVGTPLGGRDQEELAEVIGYFVNMMALRLEIPSGSFWNMVDTSAAALLGGMRHALLPFVEVFHGLGQVHDPSRGPVFQTMLAWAGEPGGWLQPIAESPSLATGVEARLVTGISTASAKCDVRLELHRGLQGEVVGELEYCSALFARSSVEPLAAAFAALLRWAGEGSRALPRPLGVALEVRAAEFEALLRPVGMSPAQRRAIVEDFNETSRSVSSSALLHEVVLAGMRRDPESAALLEGQERTTHGELRALVAAFAEALSALVLEGDVVGLWLPRSRLAVVSMLGTLQAGGAYLPCDEALPPERVAYMLEVSGAAALLVDAPRLELARGLCVCVRDAEDLAPRTEPRPRGAWLPSPERPAYVIFTSGSTGRPKGVAVAHRSIAHLVEWVNTEFRVGPKDVLLFVTSIGFDLSCYDVFGVLAAGACVRIAPPGASPEVLFGCLRDGVTFWDSAPPVLQQLEPLISAHLSSGGLLPDLRVAFLSGDWVPLPLASLLLRACPQCRLTALGGATEVTVWSNFFPVTSVDPAWRSVPYGRPIWNHQYYALDGAGEPVSLSNVGRLHIGGVGVAMGYIGREDITAERFLRNPFHGGRMYDVGDLVRFMQLSPWGPCVGDVEAKDIVLEFLGRADFQVKINGYRVELGEVERACGGLPGVDSVVVLAVPGAASTAGPGVDRRLVAFLTPSTADSEETRVGLRSLLPHYMVPELIVPLSTMPLSANGKVDRKALEAMDLQAASRAQRPLRLAKSETEHHVVAAFVDVLGLAESQEVGVDDDFFQLGGHSLTALRLQSHLRGLTVQDVFTHRTPAALAKALGERAIRTHEGQAGACGASVLRSALAVPSPPPLLAESPATEGGCGEQERVAVASFAQERLWLVEQLAPRQPTYNVPFAYRLTGVSVDALRDALERLVARHESLRTVLRPRESGDLSQVVLRPASAEGSGCDLISGGECRKSCCLAGPRRSRDLQVNAWMWLHDLRDLSASKADKATLRLLHEDVQEGFDLSRGVLRVRIVRLPSWSSASKAPARTERSGFSPSISPLAPQRFPPSPAASPAVSPMIGDRMPGSMPQGRGQRCILYVNVHHVAFDAASLPRFERDLWRLYSGEELPPEVVHYADYSLWQRRWLLEQGELERALGYWLGELSGARLSLDLPTDFPHPAKLELRGSAFSASVPSSVAKAVRAMSHRQRTSEHRVLLAAYGVLLSRICSQRDLLIGIPVAAREHNDQLHTMIGFFVNTVAVRIDIAALAPNATFSSLVGDVHSRVLRAMQNSELPWQTLVGELRRRGAVPEQGSPVVQSLFDFTPAAEFDFHRHSRGDALDGARVAEGVFSEPWCIRRSCSRLDPCCPGAGRIAAKFELSLDVSGDARTGGYAMLWEFCTELFQEASVRNFARRFVAILEAACLSPSLPISQLPSVPQREAALLAHHWHCAPSAPLPELSVQEAFLQQAARTPHSRALQLEDGRCCSYAALLRRARAACGLLRLAGARPGAFLGVLAHRGPEPLYAMLGALLLGAAYVPLDHTAPLERLRYVVADAGVALVATSPAWEHLASQLGRAVVISGAPACDLALEAPGRGDAPMYLLYTSGSTGRPKGVAVPHRAVLSFVLTEIEKYALQPFDSCLHSIPLVFDFAVAQIYPHLSIGSCVLLPSEETSKDPHAMASLVARLKTSTANFVPTIFSFFLASESAMRGLRSLRRLDLGGEAVSFEVCRQAMACLDADLAVSYGPTEAAVDTTTWKPPRPFVAPVASCPIGSPDPWRGLCVALLHREGEADALAVPAGTPGELCIEGLGLARGYWRAEGQTRAAFRPSASGSGAAYCTGDLVRWRGRLGLDFLGRIDAQVKISGRRIELGEVESALQELPSVAEAAAVVVRDGEACLVAYVRPAVVLSAPGAAEELLGRLAARLPSHMLPKKLFGIDEWPCGRTGKLDRAELARRAAPEVAIPALAPGPQVASLLEIVAVVTGRPADASQTFALLGGDSIAAIRAAARLRDQGLDLAPAQLLGRATLGELAASLRATPQPATVASSSAVPLGPMQSRFFAQRLPHPEHYNQSQLLALRRRVGRQELIGAVAELAQAHEMLRARYVDRDGEVRQDVLPMSSFSAPSVVQEFAIGAGDLGPLLLRMQSSLCLESGRLLAVALLHVSGHADHLFLAVHHLAVDLVSWEALLEDLQEALESGGLPRRRGTTFAEWASRRPPEPSASLASVEAPEALGGAERNTWGDARRLSVEADAATSRALLGAANEAYRTRAVELLLAALAEGFRRFAGGALLVDLEGHGRDPSDPGLQRTVGWFTALRAARLRAESSLEATIRGAKEAHRRLRLDGSGAAPPEARPAVCFNYHGSAGRLSDISGALFAEAQAELAAVPREDIHPENPREYLLEVEGLLEENLRFEWIFPRGMEQKVRPFAEAFAQALREVAAHCLGVLQRPSGFCRFTPSDFPSLAAGGWALSLAALDGLLNSCGSGFQGAAGHAVVEDIYPCTPLQEGLLAETLLDKTANVEQLALLLTGPLDAGLWRHAWSMLIRRHAVLRTRIAPLSDARAACGVFWQLVCRPETSEAEWAEVEWEVQGSDWREADFLEHLARDRACGFACGGPMCRFTLFRVGQSQHIFLWTGHHALTDGWSTPLLLQEALLLYDASGDPSALGPLPPPFRLYVEEVSARRGEALGAFWKSQLQGWSPQREACAGASEYLQLSGSPATAAAALAEVGRQHGATLAAVLHAAWALTLAHATSSPDVLFGVVLSGRDLAIPEIERMVGMLICTLPLRVRLRGEMPLGDLIRLVHQSLLGVTAHQHCNFAEIREWCGIRGASQDLFQSLLVVENYPGSPSRAGAPLQVSPLPMESLPVTGARLPLAVVVALGEGGGLRLTLRCASAVHSRASTAGLLHGFRALLDVLAGGADFPCGALVKLVGMAQERPSSCPVRLAAGCRSWLPVLFRSAVEDRLSRAQLPLVSQGERRVPLPASRSLESLAAALAALLARLGSCRSVVVVLAREAPALVDLRCFPEALLAELAAECAVASPLEGEPLGEAAPEGHVWVAVAESEAALAALPLLPELFLVPGELGSRLGPELAALLADGLPGALEARSVGEVPLASLAARRLLVEDFNDTAQEWQEARLHELLQRSARLAPGHAAVVEEERETSYAELAALASALSRAFPEKELVALWLPRSLEFIACALGVLSAGSAYLPCDEGLPVERVAYMLGISAAGLCVSVDAARLEGASGVLAVCIGSLLLRDSDGRLRLAVGAEEATRGVQKSRPALRHDGSPLAYVIFTSGSTGKPKGVAVSHRSIAHLCTWVNSAFEVGQADVLLFTASVGFDLSCYDIFGSLAAGATVRIAPPGATPEELFALVRDRGVTFWDSAPPVLGQLEAAMTEIAESGGALPKMRVVFMSGDWIPLQLASLLLRVCPNAHVTALGGATEVTVWSNCFRIREVDRAWRSIPYGRPIWNHQYYALDDQMSPLHLGMPGELFIGGVGVALGYIGREDLTDERFMPNPFHDGRMYRTGDVVRWMPLSPWGRLPEGGEPGPLCGLRGGDVVLEFLGRKDSQVKIRGFRVELGEVEQALEALPQVSAAAVLAVGSAEKRLVAFVMPELDVARLREELARSLPRYMLPGLFVAMPSLPLSSSGKLDRAALRAVDLEAAARGRRAFRAPETAAERLLAEAMAAALGVAEVGLDDDFFELGGHSLAALRLLARLRSQGLQELSLQEIFELRTPARLAARAPRELLLQAPRGPPPLRASPSAGALEASFAQERLWLVDRLRPGAPSYNIAFAYRARGPGVSLQRLESALRRLLQRHEVLRTVLRPNADGSLAQLVLPLGSSEGLPDAGRWLWVRDLRDLEREAAEASAVGEAKRDAASGFDLGRGVLRARLFDLPGDVPEALLYVNIHHVAFDGLSMPIFERELWALYSEDSPEERGGLAPLQVQYSDYAGWQRRWLEQGALEWGLRYWSACLQGSSGLLRLPVDRPHGGEAEGRQHRSRWPSGVSSRVLGLAEGHGTTEMCALLALFGAVLARHCRQEDLLVAVPEAGRSQDPALEGLLGFFVNTLPVRLRIEGTLSAVLRMTHRALLGALEHGFVPLQHIVSQMKASSASGREPLLQAFFQHYQRAEFQHGGRGCEAAGCEVSPWAFEGSGSRGPKFELSLQATSGAEGHELLWEYDAQLFRASTIRLFGRHLLALARAAVCEPSLPLDAIGAFETERQRRVVAHDWPVSLSPPLPEARVEELFAQQARRSPHGAALCLPGRSITYAALAASARRASAAFLDAVSARRVTSFVVGVLAPRSSALVVGVLGALLAGGVFLPLAPELPDDRLRYMLGDAQPGVIAAARAEDAARAAVCGGSVVPIVRLDALPHSEPPTMPQASSSMPLYVIYTSGSTGRPKGVSLSHAALVSHLLPYIRTLGLGESDRVLMTSPFTFDMAYSQIFGALLSGAALVVTVENPMQDPAELADMLLAEMVTCTTMVPSVLSMLLPVCSPLPALRHLGSGGEALPSALARAVFDRAGALALHNRYGPTESAVNAALFGPLGAEAWRRLARCGPTAPIGWPSAHRHLRPEALGFPERGPEELLISGRGLASGYLGREDLTAASFPSCPRAAGRAYRSGDRVRRGPRGCLVFVGREDCQVKVHGQRVELGEVEVALRDALARGGAEGSVVAVVLVHIDTVARLVACVAPALADGGAALAECRRLLPSHMVPQAVLGLASMPRTSSGKVDRKSLERLALEGQGQGPLRPGSGALSVFLGVLQEVLGRAEPLAAEQSVAELGLTSLAAVHAWSLAATRGVRGLTVRGLLRAEGSIAEAAAGAVLAAGEAGSAGAWRELLGALAAGHGVRARPLGPLGPGAGPSLFICPGDGGLGGDGYRPLALALGARMRALVLDGLLGRWECLDGLAAECARAILEALGRAQGRCFWLLGHSWGCMLALEVARQLEGAGEMGLAGVMLLDPSPELFEGSSGSAEGAVPAGAPGEGEVAELLRLALHGRGEAHSEIRLLPTGASGSEADGVALVQAARDVMADEEFANLRSLASARARNLRLRPLQWPRYRQRVRASVVQLLAMGLDDAEHRETADWQRITKRAVLTRALEGLAEEVHTTWAEGDHYSILAPPLVEGVARQLIAAAATTGQRRAGALSTLKGALEGAAQQRAAESNGGLTNAAPQDVGDSGEASLFAKCIGRDRHCS